MVKKLSSMETIDSIKLFKEAVIKNDVKLLHVLLKSKILDVNATFDVNEDGLSLEVFKVRTSSLVYYAGFKGRLDIVKLLLLHGADVTKKITTNPRRNPGKSHRAPIDFERDLNSSSIKSLVCIGYAEAWLSLLNNNRNFAFSKLSIEEFKKIKILLGSSFPKIEAIDYDYKGESICFTNQELSDIKKKLDELNTKEAKTFSAKLEDKLKISIEWFKCSAYHDLKIINEYIQQVQQDKMGFRFHYDEDLLSKLNVCFGAILNQKTCTII